MYQTKNRPANKSSSTKLLLIVNYFIKTDFPQNHEKHHKHDTSQRPTIIHKINSNNVCPHQKVPKIFLTIQIFPNKITKNYDVSLNLDSFAEPSVII